MAEKAIPFELLTEVPWDSTTATPLHNPLEKLPVLILEHGTSVYEFRFILEWIEMKHPSPPMLPADADERLAARKIEVVCDACVLMFWEATRPISPPVRWLGI